MVSKTTKLIRESIDKAGGDLKKARRLVKQELENDPETLFDMVAPFIDGIIAHAVQRVAKGKNIGTTQATKRPMEKVVRTSKSTPQIKKSPQAPQDISKGGMNALLSHLSKNVDGKENTGTKRKPSKQHMDAMNMIAKASFVTKKR